MFLNYHHLRYFWAIVQEGGLGKAAARLHVSQSALSIQLRQLEESLGHALFTRRNRRLTLTEAGHVTLQYANTIFRAGEELLDTLQHRGRKARQIVRVGAVATLSRNFQWEFLKPLRARRDVEVVLRSGNLRELMLQLRNHAVDVVLSNAPHARDAESTHRSHLLSEQAVSIVGRPGLAQKPLRFPEDLRDARMVLPSLESDIRAALDLLLDQAGLRPEVVAEVEDMAMLRILTVRLGVLAVAPRVVVQDELRRGELVEYRRLEMIQERFYAITQARQFPNAVVEDLIGRFGGKEGSASRSARR